MTALQISALILVGIQVCVAMFQLALALGAPMGEYAWGGQNEAVLPKRLRVASAVNIAVYAAIGGHYLAQSGILKPLLEPSLNTIANWVLVGFMALGLLMNGISKSKKERQMWVPVLLLSVVCSVIVALG